MKTSTKTECRHGAVNRRAALLPAIAAMASLFTGVVSGAEIAYKNGWMSREQLEEVYEIYKKNQYGAYLKDILDGKYIE